jgi:hypothetical protein
VINEEENRGEQMALALPAASFANVISGSAALEKCPLESLKLRPLKLCQNLQSSGHYVLTAIH